MKRFFKFTALAMMLCVLHSGCSDSINDSSSDFSSSVSADESTTGTVSEPELVSSSAENQEPQSFFLTMSINLSEADSANYLAYKCDLKDGKTRLSMRTTVNADTSISQDEVQIKVWIICDNEFIPFSLDGGEYKKENIFTQTGRNSTSSIVEFDSNVNMRTVTVVISALPYDIPELKLGLYSGICSYTFVNTACPRLDDVPEITGTENYVTVGDNSQNTGIGIDIRSLEENHQSGDAQFAEDFVVSDSDNVYVKFNCDAIGKDDKPLNVYYSLFVICDGEIIPAFDGKEAAVVYTPFTTSYGSSQKAFQQVIPSQYYSKEGMHCIQAVAVPYYIPQAVSNITEYFSFGYDGFSSNKTRVVYNQETP